MSRIRSVRAAYARRTLVVVLALVTVAVAAVGWLQRQNTLRSLAARKAELDKQVARVEMDIQRNEEVLQRLRSPNALRQRLSAVGPGLVEIRREQVIALYEGAPRMDGAPRLQAEVPRLARVNPER
jgi:HAMP domain-containing protein